MANFADKFLKELEELSASDEGEEIKSPGAEGQEDEDDDFAEYQEREQKVEELMTKGYQSKIRGNQAFTEYIESLDRDISGQISKRQENLPQKEISQGLIVQTNKYLKHIDNDILIVHK
jgi:hypothetical protein